MSSLSTKDFLDMVVQHANACAKEGCHPREHILREAARRITSYELRHAAAADTSNRSQIQCN